MSMDKICSDVTLWAIDNFERPPSRRGPKCGKIVQPFFAPKSFGTHQLLLSELLALSRGVGHFSPNPSNSRFSFPMDGRIFRTIVENMQ